MRVAVKNKLYKMLKQSYDWKYCIPKGENQGGSCLSQECFQLLASKNSEQKCEERDCKALVGAPVFTILQGVFLVTVHWLLWVHPWGSWSNPEEGGSGNAWIRKTSFPKNHTIGSCFCFMTAQKEVRKRGLKIKGGLAKQKCLWQRPSSGSCKNGHLPVDVHICC